MAMDLVFAAANIRFGTAQAAGLDTLTTQCRSLGDRGTFRWMG